MKPKDVVMMAKENKVMMVDFKFMDFPDCGSTFPCLWMN